MTRVVYAPRAWMDQYGNAMPDRPTATVYEHETTAQATGLLDVNGTPLYRTVEREPIGFQVRMKA